MKYHKESRNSDEYRKHSRKPADQPSERDLTDTDVSADNTKIQYTLKALWKLQLATLWKPL